MYTPRRPLFARLIPGLIIPAAVLIAIPALESCAGGGSLGFAISPDAPLIGSHSALDAMSDQEYIAYVREAVAMVTEGDSWGERLLRFMDENSVYIPEREARRKRENPGEQHFWLTVYRPDPRSDGDNVCRLTTY